MQLTSLNKDTGKRKFGVTTNYEFTVHQWQQLYLKTFSHNRNKNAKYLIAKLAKIIFYILSFSITFQLTGSRCYEQDSRKPLHY
jgi:hypothetical protein